MVLVLAGGLPPLLPGLAARRGRELPRLARVRGLPVNASIDTAGTVSGVSLRSEAGGRCEFLSPWAGAAAPKAVCGGAAVHVAAVAGEPAPRFAFSTEAGQACTLAA